MLDYILWIKVSKNYINLENHIVFGVVYIPPMNSRFYNNDEFETFGTETTSMCSENEHISGDFNAQTGEIL